MMMPFAELRAALSDGDADVVHVDALLARDTCGVCNVNVAM